MGEIKFNFDSQVKEVNEKLWYSLTGQYILDETKPKHCIVYFYDDAKGTNFVFKALSVDKWLVDDFAFFALANPSEKLT